MIKNDYLVTQMRQLTEVVTKVLGLIDNKQFKEGHEIINQAFKQFLGLNTELAESLNYKDLINLTGAYESSEVIKLMLLAEILKLHADVCITEGNITKGFNINLKSLNIYISAALLDLETCVELLGSKIDELISKIDEYEIPYESKFYIFQYYEAVRRYNKAEDVLFELMEDTGNSGEIIDEGIKFYNRLIDKPESELEEGNLPLNEVKEELMRFKTLK